MHNRITFQTTEDGTKIEEKSYPMPKTSNIASAADVMVSRSPLASLVGFGHKGGAPVYCWCPTFEVLEGEVR